MKNRQERRKLQTITEKYNFYFSEFVKNCEYDPVLHNFTIETYEYFDLCVNSWSNFARKKHISVEGINRLKYEINTLLVGLIGNSKYDASFNDKDVFKLISEGLEPENVCIRLLCENKYKIS